MFIHGPLSNCNICAKLVNIMNAQKYVMRSNYLGES